jgi:ethanolamine permease
MSAIMMVKFRRMYPMGTIHREYVSPFHPIPSIILMVIVT